jgi:hypothetical protein
LRAEGAQQLIKKNDVETLQTLLGMQHRLPDPIHVQHRWTCETRTVIQGADEDEILNRFIGNALSLNWLRHLPPDVSLYTNEYDREDVVLDLNDILDFKPILLTKGKWATPRVLALQLKDHRKVIPDFVLMSTSLRAIEPIYVGMMTSFGNAEYTRGQQQQEDQQVRVTKRRKVTKI